LTPAFQIFDISIHSKDICQQSTNLSEIVHCWLLVSTCNQHACLYFFAGGPKFTNFCPCWWVV